MSTVLKSKSSRAQNHGSKKLMFALTAIFGFCFIVTLFAEMAYESGLLFSIAITFGVTFYHFAIRLIIGYFTDRILGNKIDCNSKWFVPKKFEHGFYKRLRIHKFKKHVPTYDPEQFDVTKHSIDEIIHSMCVAEVCHEIIVPFALLPIFLTIPFGDFCVFFITSVLSAAFDLSFVIVQRYNRPRAMRLLKRNT